MTECATLPEAEVYPALGTRPTGLTQAEATERRRQVGPNRLREPPRQPLILKLLANFTHLMALLLWAGGLIGFLAQLPQLGLAIWSVNLINGLFSFWQEYQAERATAALRRLLPDFARVLRDGLEQRLPADDLVPGDVIVLAEGDHISADGRLVAAADLAVDQSTLTGEARPVHKSSAAIVADHQPRADLPNLVFAGTSVATGTGTAVVIATGMETAFGTIAHLTQSVGEEASPLHRELGRVTRAITVLATSIGLLFFLLAVLVAGVDLATGFLFAMGMIVAFVPEGMLPTVTLSLAMAVRRMARRQALVKRLSAVETLGCTTVICTDKTGTLTRNEMTVRSIWTGGQRVTVTGTGYAPTGQLLTHDQPVPLPLTGDARQVVLAASLCGNSRLLPPTDAVPHWSILGDPTEGALRVAAVKAGLDLAAEERLLPRRRELPFDAHRKRMTTIHDRSAVSRQSPMARSGRPSPPPLLVDTAPGPPSPPPSPEESAGEPSPPPSPRGRGSRPAPSPQPPAPRRSSRRLALVKGAPREMLARCAHIRVAGQDIALDATWRAAVEAAIDEDARAGLRVLGVAQRDLPDDLLEAPPAAIERELTLLGLVAMLDPPRPEVTAAVAACHRAGIRVIMITGDYGLTAESIARQIGIVRADRPRLVTGADLETMDEASLAAALSEEVIFARVDPEHKLRVVEALRHLGHVVAVTGDGVNDAPALKRADIGVAMGLAGTDVAREAADMILTDDNFASIVGAVEEGRAVYANIRKFAVYVFNSNMAEAVPFVAMLFSRGAIPLPLTVMQVLAIDLGTDMVPAIGLGAEAPEAGVMDRPPRARHERLLSRGLLARALLWYGLIEATAGMAAYIFLNARHGWPGVPLASEGTPVYQLATTMTLAGIVASQVGAVFACRTDRASVFRVGLLSNRLVLLGVAVEVVLLAALAYVPWLGAVFHTAPLDLVDWLFVAAWAPLILLADEGRKWLLRWGDRRAWRGGP